MIRLATLTLLGALACASSSDYDHLIAELRSRGIAVSEVDVIEQPFFTGRARVLRANEEDIQVYEFDSAAAAEAAAAKVSPNGGSISTNSMHWMAAPHFHRSGRLIAIHLGANANVRDALNAILGKQFAGQ
ncbi:MAG TPA: hypothetical protein VIL97_08955 [Thermoanaerobaculia bacterium]